MLKIKLNKGAGNRIHQILMKTLLFIVPSILFLSLVSSLQADLEDANIDWRMHEGETIKVFVPTHPYMDSLKPFLPEFEELTGIALELEESSEQQYLNKLLLDLSSGNPNTDVFMALHNRIAQYATGGWIEGLNSYMENPELYNEEWYDIDDYAAGAKFMQTYKGVLYALPIVTEQMTMFYRKDLFEKAGVMVPDTQEELYEVAKKLKALPEVDGGVSVRIKRNESDWHYSAWIATYGGVWVDPMTGMPHLDSPEAIAATDMFVKLMKDAGPTGAMNYGWFEGYQAFAQGKLAIFIDANAFIGIFEDPEKSKVAGKVGYALMPAAPNGNRAVSGITSWSWGIASGSKKKEAAWLLCLWATSKEMSKKTGPSGWIARTSSWADPALAEMWPADYIETNAVGLEKYSATNSYPKVPEIGPVGDIVMVALQEVFAGKYTAEEAMMRAQEQTLEALDK
jgi:multiple sugar transport system substrate-binding protein